MADDESNGKLSTRLAVRGGKPSKLGTDPENRAACAGTLFPDLCLSSQITLCD